MSNALRISRDTEARSLRLVEHLRGGNAPDSLSATHASWPKANAVARALAGHANAARGRELLWLIGVDGRGRVSGADATDFAAWQEAVTSRFDGLPPAMTVHVIPLEDGRKAAAIRIETARAPFAVRTGKGAQLEVPWRDAVTGVLRSSSRMDLVRAFSPLGELPHLEVLEAELAFFRNMHARTRAVYRWTLDASVYVVPRSGDRLILPIHGVRAGIEIPAAKFRGAGMEINLTADKHSPGIRVTESAVLVEGLGRFFFFCVGATEVESLPWNDGARFVAEFLPVGAETNVVAAAALRSELVLEPNQVARWKA